MGNVMIIFTVCVVLVYSIKGLVQNGFINKEVKAVNTIKMWDMVGFSFYSFEGIGTVMPIRACTKYPEMFPKILTISLITLGTLFVIFGMICYMYFGHME